MANLLCSPSMFFSLPCGCCIRIARCFRSIQRIAYSGCNFAVSANTDDEVAELARMHQEIAHGVKEISPDLEEKIKESIRPVSADGHQF